MLKQVHQELHNFLFADGLFENLEIEVRKRLKITRTGQSWDTFDGAW